MVNSRDLWFIYCHDKTPRRPFAITVNKSDAKKTFAHIGGKLASRVGERERFSYWKLNEPCSDLEVLPLDEKLENIATRLPSTSHIAPFLTSNLPKAHIIVEYVPYPTVKEETEQDDIVTNMQRSFKKLLVTAKNTPSTAAKSKEYRGSQAGNDRAPLLYDCRYADNDTTNTAAPAIQLFNPAFAHFSSNAFNPNFNVPNEEIRKTVALVNKFSAIYFSEEDRNKAISGLLGGLLDSAITIVQNVDGTQLDGGIAATTPVDDSVVYLALNEDKNEIGDGGSDPSTQAGFSYAQTIAQLGSKVAHICCHPTFLIVQAGPWLVILGAVFTDKLIIQRLTDFIWIPVHSCHDDDQYLRVARLLYALRNALKILDKWYTDTITTVPQHDPNQQPPSPHSRFFPTPSSYHDANNQVISFVYQRTMESDASCVTYLAETTQARKVVVKFVNRYGADAHRVLAKAGHAPELLYYGEIDASNPSLYGDLRMVVMELIDGTTAYDALNKTGLPESFMTDLKGAIELLHSKGFVFGDLRLPNIMISIDKKIKLIDFDWAGKEGEVCYPVTLSRSISWPEGVEGLELIQKQHDLQMIQKLHLM